MTRRGAPARRTTSNWIVRGSLALIAAATGYFTVSRTLAESVRRFDPVKAHQLAPENGQITASLAQKQLKADPTLRRGSGRIVELAHLALRQDAAAVPAVTTLGFEAQLRGNLPASRRLFAYAQALSRRDLQTQLWAIENAVSRDDVAGALHHYDIALRTSKTAPDLLFPVLAGAIVEPSVRVAMTRQLAARPPWAGPFLDFLAEQKVEPDSLADLLSRLKAAHVAVPSGAVANVVAELLKQGNVDRAWAFYRTIHPGASRARSRDPRFDAKITTPSAFDWTPVNDPVIAATIQRGADGGVFDFAAPATSGGTMLTQRQILPPGVYRLQGRSTGVQQPPESAPYWQITCPDGREVARINVPNSSLEDGKFAGRFVVPADCPIQTLALVARPSNEVSGSAGQIEYAAITPASDDN